LNPTLDPIRQGRTATQIGPPPTHQAKRFSHIFRREDQGKPKTIFMTTTAKTSAIKIGESPSSIDKRRAQRARLIPGLVYYAQIGFITASPKCRRPVYFHWDRDTSLWWLVRLSRDRKQMKRIAYVHTQIPFRVAGWQIRQDVNDRGPTCIVELMADGSHIKVWETTATLTAIELRLVKPKPHESIAFSLQLAEYSTPRRVQNHTSAGPANWTDSVMCPEFPPPLALPAPVQHNTKSSLGAYLPSRMTILLYGTVGTLMFLFIIIGFQLHKSNDRIARLKTTIRQEINHTKDSLSSRNQSADELLKELKGYYIEKRIPWSPSMVFAVGYSQMFKELDLRNDYRESEEWETLSTHFRRAVTSATISLAGDLYLEYRNIPFDRFIREHGRFAYVSEVLAAQFLLLTATEDLANSAQLELNLVWFAGEHTETAMAAVLVAENLLTSVRLEKEGIFHSSSLMETEYRRNTAYQLMNVVRIRKMKFELSRCTSNGGEDFTRQLAIIAPRQCPLLQSLDSSLIWEDMQNLETKMLLYCESGNATTSDCL
jgi:hypothetical protein